MLTHIPSAVTARFKRANQYSRGVRRNHCRLWNTGSPDQVGRWHRCL